jgi:hypothetical protein
LARGGSVQFTEWSIRPHEEPRSIAVGDLNGDSLPDLAIANRLSGTISIFAGRGDGTFLAPVGFSASLNPHAIVTADFNGDQLLDLAVANTGTNSVTLFRNDGAIGGVPRFSSLPDIPAGQGSTALTVVRPQSGRTAGSGGGRYLQPMGSASSWRTVPSVLKGPGSIRLGSSPFEIQQC